MFETKYSKFLTVVLIIIIIAIVGLLVYIITDNIINSKKTAEAAEFVGTYNDEVSQNKESNATNTEDNGDNILDGIETAESKSDSKKEYKGFEVLATIEIPKINLKYPVLAKVTKKSLETAVAVMYPENAELNTAGNIVIAGHNYRNGSFFSNLKKLSLGDVIYITDLSGKKLTYTIYNIFEASENDTSFYNRDTNGAKEITLSTCTDDSTARTIVEAKVNE